MELLRRKTIGISTYATSRKAPTNTEGNTEWAGAGVGGVVGVGVADAPISAI